MSEQLNNSVRDSLLTSLLLQNACISFLEYVKTETNGDGKRFLNILITRLKANTNDCYSKITTDKGREAFVKEFTKEDALQYANVFLMLLEMNKDSRDTAERIITQLHKGEVVEIKEPASNY